MSQKTFSLTAGVLFLLIALGHVLRLAFGKWDITISGRPIPHWPSWVALVIAGYLAYEGFRLGRAYPLSGKAREPMPNSDTIDRAWRYYKHADDLQHRRHLLFLTVQVALVAGFIHSSGTTTQGRLNMILAFAGIGCAIFWATLAETVQKGMSFLNEELEADDLYRQYLDKARFIPWLSGRWMLNIYLPTLLVGLWLVLIATRK